MRYERPTILRREPLRGLLDVAKSEQPEADVVAPSDVHVKDNIVPVGWGSDTVEYAPPGIAHREPLQGLLGTAKSNGNVKPDS